MPKTIYIPEDARSSGIDITWTPSAGRLDIGGWYDTMVGLQPGSMTLAEFFAKLGITEKDVRKALSANAQGEHSTGATAEGDMLDPVVVPDFAHGNAPEKKLKKLPQGVDTTRGLW